MDNITYAVSVDVNNPIIPYNVYVANVLDSNVRYLEITLYQNGNVIALSNTASATASLVTDDVLIDDSVECTISDNIITVPLEDLQRHGNLDVQVIVTEGTKVLAIPFPIQVRATPNIAENAQIDENSLGSYAEVVHEIVEARGTHTTLHDAITAKLSAAPGAVGTENLADESITVEKVAADLAAAINAKEVKSNKKTMLTGNESSNDFYPTTKAVADALNTKASSLSNRLALHISVGFNANGVPVKFVGGTTISSGAFTNSDVTKIFISQDVQTISGGAFSGCPALSDIYFDSTSTSYDNNTIPSGVTAHTLDNYHIMNCILDCVKYLDDNKVQSISSGRLPTTADSIHYPSVAAVKDFLYANFYTDDEVVTDVIYSDEDLSEYSSVNSTSNRNQACVVIAPNEVDPYFLKSAQVKTEAGTPVKFSVFGISNFYSQDSMNRKKFTKVRDIVVINADDDGVARIEFNLPMRFIPDETVLVASCDTSQSSFFYGPYKDAQHTIFNYNYSWFDLQPGEFDSHPFGYNTSGDNSPYFVLEYVLVSNTTEIKKSAAEILQEQEYFSPYDNFVSDTSENPVQNKVLYEELNITETETIIPEDISFLSGNTHTVSVYTRCAFALFRIGSLDSYYLKKLDIRVKSDVNVKIWTAHWKDYSPGSTTKYIVLDELKDTITSVDTHAVYEPSEPLFIEDPSNTFVVALTDEAGIGYRNIAAGLYSNGIVYLDNTSPAIYYDLTTGDKIRVPNFNPNYVNPETPPAVSRQSVAYEMVYRLAESKTVTTVTNVKEAVENLLETAETLPNTFYNPLEGKKWAACGDSITHGVTGVGEEVIPYPNIIADRNGMVLYRDGMEGTTMMQIDASNPGYKQPFCLDRVKSIPKDSDYVTIWFGINDASQNGTIGSIDDAVSTTYYGAWNISMQWIIANLPNARIGLVVSHHTPSAYCDVVRNIAKKYGVKVFDIPGDPLIPFWHISSANASYVDANIKDARMAEWWVNIGHPNTKGYEYISNPFENWMRSL